MRRSGFRRGGEGLLLGGRDEGGEGLHILHRPLSRGGGLRVEVVFLVRLQCGGVACGVVGEDLEGGPERVEEEGERPDRVEDVPVETPLLPPLQSRGSRGVGRASSCFCSGSRYVEGRMRRTWRRS